MSRMRITWLDGTTLVVRRDEAKFKVNDFGVIKVTRGARTTFIPPTSYKFVDFEA